LGGTGEALLSQISGIPPPRVLSQFGPAPFQGAALVSVRVRPFRGRPLIRGGGGGGEGGGLRVVAHVPKPDSVTPEEVYRHRVFIASWEHRAYRLESVRPRGEKRGSGADQWGSEVHGSRCRAAVVRCTGGGGGGARN